MMRFLTRYHPRFVRSLVYLLQASEYELGPFIEWYRRVSDFRRVERKGRLDPTLKARLLLLIGWITVAVALLTAALLIAISPLASFILLLLGPEIVVFVLAIVVALGTLLVKPLAERVALRAIKARLAGRNVTKIAIAGSYGKTTMKEILRSILSAKLQAAATPGNLNTPTGIKQFIESLTGKEEILIFELGEYQRGDIAALAAAIRPSWGVITGINQAHLSRFKTLEQTSKAIFELGDFIPADALYVNGEDEHVQQAAQQAHRHFSRSKLDNWIAEGPTTDLTGTRFVAKQGKRSVRATTKLLGLHHVGPLLVAIDLAARLGLSDREIKEGLAIIELVPHRLAPRELSPGATFIDDSYNGNPDGVRVALEFLRAIKNRRRIYLTPGLVELGEASAEVHRTIGRELATTVEVVGLTKTSVTPWIAEGLKEANFTGELRWFDSTQAALAALPSITKPGDVVLLQNDWPDQYA